MKGIQIQMQRTAKGIGDFIEAVCDLCPDPHIQHDSYVNHLISKIDELNTRYFSSWEDYHRNAQAERYALNGRSGLVEQLKTEIRDFWSGLKRRTKRKNHPSSILGEFRKPQFQDAIATLNRSADIISVAKTFVRGDQILVEKGYPAMINPSAEELQKTLAAIQAIDNNLSFFASQQAFKRDLSEGIRLHRLLGYALQVNHSELDLATLRRLMREYGFILGTQRQEGEDAMPEEESIDSPILDDVNEPTIEAAVAQTLAELEASIDEEVIEESDEEPLFD